MSHLHHFTSYSTYLPSSFVSFCPSLSYLTSEPFASASLPSNRSVQSEADEVRGPRAGTSPGTCPWTGGTGQVVHLQQISVQRQSGGEESHSGGQWPHCGHRGHSGLSGSIE